MKVTVVGGGGFGRGLALVASESGHEVSLWSRTVRDGMGTVVVSNDPAVVEAADLILVATPAEHATSIADALCEHVDGRHMLVHVSRGLSGPELTPLSKVFSSRTAIRRVGALGGPLSSEVLLNRAPAGAIVGSEFPEVEQAVREALGGVRIYGTHDVVGVEVCSAMVGLLALALGFLSETALTPSSIGFFLSRGLAEATRFGVRLGANERTFAGLAGAGDLFSAVAGDDRPELRLGQALARGLPLAEAGQATDTYVEGVTIARRVATYAARHRIEAPIATVIADVIEGTTTIAEGLTALIARPAHHE